MRVHELIAALKEFNPNLEIKTLIYTCGSDHEMPISPDDVTLVEKPGNVPPFVQIWAGHN